MSANLAAPASLANANDPKTKSEQIDALVTRCAGRLRLIVLYHLNKLAIHDSPSDGVQTVIKTLIAKINRGESLPTNDTDFWKYVNRVVCYKILDFKQDRLMLTHDEITDQVEALSSTDDSPIFKDLLETFIKSLPREELRQLLLLRLEGHSYKEIAEILNVDKSTIGRRSTMLRKRWCDLYGDPGIF